MLYSNLKESIVLKHCIIVLGFLNIIMTNEFYQVSSSISGNKMEKHSSLECNVFEHKTKHEVDRFVQQYFYTKKEAIFKHYSLISVSF